MTPQQARLVKESFAPLEKQLAGLVSEFFQELFESRPELRPKLGSSPVARGGILGRKLVAIIGALHRPDEVIAEMRALGRSKPDLFGLNREDFAAIGTAILVILRDRQDCRIEVEQAWTAVYAALSGALAEGGKEAAATAAA